MIISGTITQAGQPSPPKGQFQVRYQDIGITDQNGQIWSGRIGSKQGYQINTPISVTVEEKQGEGGPYNYFRKYNPQYQGQQTTPQNVPQTPSQPAQQVNKAKGVDWDAKDLRIARQAGIRSAVMLAAEGKIPVDSVVKKAEEYTDYVYKGLHSPNQLPVGGQSNPDYQENPDPPPDDDIPF